MIQFNKVNKRYKGNDFSLEDISFRVEPGEFVFLIGPSGSGKTTVVKLLIREELPTDGKIYFDDYDITKLSRNSVYKLRRQVGVVFQDYKLVPDKTVYENVAFAMEVGGKKTAEIEETVPYLLDIVGLTSRTDAFPDHLSGGEKQRVAIARAVANNPRVLIADEPTGNLDPGSAWDIVQILTKINNWGTTVVMSTHGTDIVNTLNKRVIQMEGGRVVRDDSKGFYEITAFEKSFEEMNKGEEAVHSEKPELQERKGPIQVKLRKQNEAAEGNQRFRIWPFGGKKAGVTHEVDFSDVNAEELMEDAADTKVDELNLATEVIEDLHLAGYEDVQQIIEEGPAGLAKSLEGRPEEVVQVAKAVTDFVEAEGHNQEKEVKPKAKPVVKPKIKKSASTSTKTKIKLDLTAKKQG